MSARPVPGALTVVPLPGVGEVRAGDDLAAVLVAACERAGLRLRDDDVLVVSSKVVAKADGLWRDDRDAAVAEETRGVVAERRTPNGVTRIVRSAAGPVMAAAGVDASNTGPDAAGRVLVLPRDPDAAAARLRDGLRRRGGARPAVLLSDTSGRPWRVGQTDFALGCAGLDPTDDLRGGVDADGQPLHVTVRAVADEVAAAADLVKGKAHGVPAAVVRGCGHLVLAEDGPGAAGLVRFDTTDWFATGTLESVRAALGCPPGTEGVEPGPAVPDADAAAVLARSVAVVTAGIRADDGSAPSDVASSDVAPSDVALSDVALSAHGDVVSVRGPAVAAGRVAERVAVAARSEGVRTTVEASAPGSSGVVDIRLRPR